MVNALTGVTTDHAPLGYIRDLFDRYAAKFERHLVEELEYQVPGKLVDMIAESGEQAFGQALDLGCGTGLVAQALSDRLAVCDGVDLSPKMLTLAAQKGIYRSLIEGDVVSLLQSPTGPGWDYDLVTAGDVFIYIGEIGSVLNGLHALMRPGGLFAFSIETHPNGGSALQPSGRFSHSADYVRNTATGSGFSVEGSDQLIIRKERGQPVPGMIFALRRLR
jgi:predicted TPR repeat methyltransferase